MVWERHCANCEEVISPFLFPKPTPSDFETDKWMHKFIYRAMSGKIFSLDLTLSLQTKISKNNMCVLFINNYTLILFPEIDLVFEQKIR